MVAFKKQDFWLKINILKGNHCILRLDMILENKVVQKLKLSLVFLLISNLSNGLRLHKFLGTKTTEANKSLKTDANGAHQ